MSMIGTNNDQLSNKIFDILVKEGKIITKTSAMEEAKQRADKGGSKRHKKHKKSKKKHKKSKKRKSRRRKSRKH